MLKAIYKENYLSCWVQAIIWGWKHLKDSYDKLRVYLIESRKASKLFAFWFASIQAELCFLFIAFEIIEGLCDTGFLSSYYHHYVMGIILSTNWMQTGVSSIEPLTGGDSQWSSIWWHYHMVWGCFAIIHQLGTWKQIPVSNSWSRLNCYTHNECSIGYTLKAIRIGDSSWIVLFS